MRHHIIMADIIKSSTYSGSDLMKRFKALVEDANKLFEKQIISPLTITLGDEFQGVVTDLATSIDLVFYIDEELLKHDYQLRYAIQWGEIETPVNKLVAYEMLGEGLTLARENLQYGKEERKRFLIAGYHEPTAERLNKTFQLYDHFYRGWSGTEKPIVLEFLSGKDYKEVAKIFGKDNSSMWRKEKSLNIKEFKLTKDIIKLVCK